MSPPPASAAARPVDHCVLPTADLATARERLSALGFTVAPEGVHPFGTANACVYFGDGTFLEPLAIRDAGIAQQAAQAGNVFVARDAAFRERAGDEGFSALVFGTGDAGADHAGFMDAGLSAGAILDFSREAADPDGGRDVAAFRLAFAADPEAPGCFFFTCQRVISPKIDRTALLRHPNGTLRIKRIVLSSGEPARFARIVAAAVNGPANVDLHAERITVPAANAAVDILAPAAIGGEFGLLVEDHPGLRAYAIVFGVSDLAAVGRHLDGRGIAARRTTGRLVVPSAPGQGAVLAFEAG